MEDVVKWSCSVATESCADQGTGQGDLPLLRSAKLQLWDHGKALTIQQLVLQEVQLQQRVLQELADGGWQLRGPAEGVIPFGRMF